MDKNSIIGLSLIGLILLGFTIYNSPSDEEIKAMNRERDSLLNVETKQKELLAAKVQNNIKATQLYQNIFRR